LQPIFTQLTQYQVTKGHQMHKLFSSGFVTNVGDVPKRQP
jgi:hypothetical protein